MFIDDIRFHINEGKTNEQIAEMYNISNLEAIEILRNASDNKDLFHYLVFTWALLMLGKSKQKKLSGKWKQKRA